MDKEKQIDEMAKIMCNCYDGGDCKMHGKLCDLKCISGFNALGLYNAGYRKIPDNIGEFSDGYHTFNELYHHRAILFSVICNSMPNKAWKSKLHDTGDMYEGMFIVGIETPEGQATYHYDIEPYWDMFKVKEIEKAPKWDGHTPQVAIDRISKISGDVVEVRHGEWVVDAYKGDEIVRIPYKVHEHDEPYCSLCGTYALLDGKEDYVPSNFCHRCGAKMDGAKRENSKREKSQ